MQRDELTREEAIRRHRKLWNYIADQTERTGQVVRKEDALARLWPDANIIANCWLCEYTKGACGDVCPMVWPGGTCTLPGETGLIDLFFSATWRAMFSRKYVKDYISLAREIANLPEREVTGE